MLAPFSHVNSFSAQNIVKIELPRLITRKFTKSSATENNVWKMALALFLSFSRLTGAGGVRGEQRLGGLCTQVLLGGGMARRVLSADSGARQLGGACEAFVWVRRRIRDLTKILVRRPRGPR